LRWIEHALSTGRKALECAADAGRSGQQHAAAIRAGALEHLVIAFGAERALERTDPRAGLIGRQVAITAFAAGSHF